MSKNSRSRAQSMNNQVEREGAARRKVNLESRGMRSGQKQRADWIWSGMSFDEEDKGRKEIVL